MQIPGGVVVGAGRLGTFHMQKLASLQADGRAKLLGVVDIESEAAAKAGEHFGVPFATTLEDLQEQLSDTVDGVVVATPTIDHFRVASDALERGAHVLVEKPIATTAREAEDLIALAEKQGKWLQVGHTERFNPAIAAALAVADRPRYIVAERLGPFSGRSTDIDVVLDLMIHDLDIVASLIPYPLKEVRALGVPVLTSEIDMAVARLEFADGSVAQLSAGRASLEPSRKLRLFTVERYVSIDCQTQEVKSVRRIPADNPGDWPQMSGEPITVPEGDALLLQDAHFFDCIRDGHKPIVDGHAGLRALLLAEQVNAEMSIPGPSID